MKRDRTLFRLVLPVALVFHCAAPGKAPKGSADRPPASVAAAASSSAGATPPASLAPERAAAELPVIAASVERELDAPVRRLAIDRPPHLAALSPRSVWIHDAKGWREEALPPALASDTTLELDVFYGRDYRVRLVGSRGAPGARVPVYLRWLPGGFKPAPEELGRLGARNSGALRALLGTADPEIVCRAGDECLVKRLSGWSRASAPPDLAALAIFAGVGFAIAGKQLLKLDGDWSSAAPSGGWDHADALFVQGTNVWVVESGPSRLHHFAGAAWQVEPSPLSHPRAVFSVAENGVATAPLWLASDAGLARLQSGVWSRVSELTRPIATLAGRVGDEVWAGGSEGLFRVRVGPAPKP